MATDIRKHTVPAAGDAPSRAAILDLGLSIRDIIPVADTTARAQLITDLTAAGIGPSVTNPVFVFRADATAGQEVEYTSNGTTWRVIRSGTRPIIASGSVAVAIPAANTPTVQEVTFPVGLFPSAPDVVAGVSSPVATVGVSAVSTTGFTATVIRSSTTSTVVTWHAILT